MDALVLPVRRAIGECFVTKFAHVRFVARVLPFVDFQRTHSRECLSTHFADVWFDARMRSHVDVERMLVLEGFLTLLEIA